MMSKELYNQVRILDRATALFKPKNLETLRPEFKELIGKRLDLRYDGIRELGTYEGKHSWQLDFKYMPIYGWIPDEDLEDIRLESRKDNLSKGDGDADSSV